LNDWKWYPYNDETHKCRKYRVWCDECGAPRGYQNKSAANKICRGCEDKRKQAVTDAKYSSEYMDFDDWKWHKSPSGNRSKKFRIRCTICKADRGYWRKSDASKHPLCRACSQVHNFKPRVSDQEEVIVLHDWIWTNPNDQNRARKYRTFCRSCKVDRGYWRRKDAERYPLCRVCGIAKDFKPKLHKKNEPINLQDWIWVKDSRGGRARQYRTFCIRCNADRGYQPRQHRKYCQACSLIISWEPRVVGIDQFNQELEDVFGPATVVTAPGADYINSSIPVDLICLKCGYSFSRIRAAALKGPGCPRCMRVYSHGEKVIADYLTSNAIDFKPEYKFDDCKDVRRLPFDFYLPDFNMCIEYDGVQHFKVGGWCGAEKLEALKKRDAIKTAYCIEKAIHLLRIPYVCFHDIPRIIEHALEQ